MNRGIFWIFALSSAVYFTQGIEGLPSQGLFYYLKETLHFSPTKIMYISSITTFAWLIKPLLGYIIDNFLTKRAWIFIALTLDIVFAAILGLNSLPLVLLIGMLVLNSGNAAIRDVAVDGIMCVEGKKNNLTGKIQSVQWISISFAGLITGIGGGMIAEKWGYKAGFLCLIPVYFAVGLLTLFYKETKPQNDYKQAPNLAKELKVLFSNKALLLTALFIFLYRYSPSFGTPLLFIQRDIFKWNKTWIGSLSTVSTIFAIIGAFIYYKSSQKINIKKWLYISVFLGALTSLSYLYYNPLTAIVYDISYSLIGMFIFIMVLDFMARNTVSGLEATSFALLTSVSNLALIVSNISGAFLLGRIGLRWLIIISAVTSFLCLPLIHKIDEHAKIT